MNCSLLVDTFFDNRLQKTSLFTQEFKAKLKISHFGMHVSKGNLILQYLLFQIKLSAQIMSSCHIKSFSFAFLQFYFQGYLNRNLT